MKPARTSAAALAAALVLGGCATSPHVDEHSGPLNRMAACIAPADERDPPVITDPVSFTAIWAYSMVHCRDGVTIADSEQAWLEHERQMKARAQRARRAEEAARRAAEAPPRG